MKNNKKEIEEKILSLEQELIKLRQQLSRFRTDISGIVIGQTYSGQYDEKCRVETFTVQKVEDGRVFGYSEDKKKVTSYSISDFKYLMGIK